MPSVRVWVEALARTADTSVAIADATRRLLSSAKGELPRSVYGTVPRQMRTKAESEPRACRLARPLTTGCRITKAPYAPAETSGTSGEDLARLGLPGPPIA